jgi:hypothetical protein
MQSVGFEQTAQAKVKAYRVDYFGAIQSPYHRGAIRERVLRRFQEKTHIEFDAGVATSALPVISAAEQLTRDRKAEDPNSVTHGKREFLSPHVAFPWVE